MEMIQIDEKAKQYIEERNADSITIKLTKRGGGWAGCTYEPTVLVGAPSLTQDYKLEEVDGIKVYISPLINMDNGIKILLSGFAMFKGLAVAPLKY